MEKRNIFNQNDKQKQFPNFNTLYNVHAPSCFKIKSTSRWKVRYEAAHSKKVKIQFWQGRGQCHVDRKYGGCIMYNLTYIDAPGVPDSTL